MEIDKQIEQCMIEGIPFIWIGDSNGKVGKKIIKDDTHEMTPNGELINNIIIKHNLYLLNSSEKCKGLWTRIDKNNKKSILDYVIASQTMCSYVKSVQIDDTKQFALQRISKKKNVQTASVTKSDHCSIFINLNLVFQQPHYKTREDTWKLTEEGLIKFNQITNKNSTIETLWQHDNVNISNKQFNKVMNSIMHQCFKKVRQTKTKPNINIPLQRLYSRLRFVQQKIAKNDQNNLINERDQIVNQINDASIKANKWYNEIKTMDTEGKLNINAFYKIKKSFANKQEPKNAIMDDNKNIITSIDLIKNQYNKEFKNRLTHKTIDPTFKHCEPLLESLFQNCINLSNQNVSQPFTIKEINYAIKSLKTKQARDPFNLKTEIFINCGESMLKCITRMFNVIKSTKQIPDTWSKIIVSTFYKKKGSRQELCNHRGIFLTPIISKLFERVLYNRIYNKLNISEFQGGGRKGRGTQENLFIIRALIDNHLNNNRPLIMVLYDFKTCFDSLWLEDTIIDLYFNGIKTDDLSLLYHMNQNCQMQIKTPFGLTKEFNVNNIVKQGTVNGPILCCTSVGQFSENCLSNNVTANLHDVEIPPIVFVDDINGFASDISQAVVLNAQAQKHFKKAKYYPIM